MTNNWLSRILAARRAVGYWDGDDLADLLRLLAQETLIPAAEIARAAAALADREIREYAAPPPPRVPYCGACGCHHYPGNCPGGCMAERGTP